MADTREPTHGTYDPEAKLSHDGDKANLDAQHHEKTSSEDSALNDPRITEFTPRQQKHIIHMVDRRLVVILGAMYCVSLMDRTNLSAANIAGYVSRAPLSATHALE
jgi:hypothetical protein